MTKFQILVKRDGMDELYWSVWKVQEGHSDKDAINKAYMSDPDTSITATVAVPVRSWRPQPIKPKAPRLDFGA